MYFPYFRGRQYEMLALKDLARGGLLGKYVTPVVEPVKLSSTFDSSLKAFSEAQMYVALIFNPSVGDLAGNLNNIAPLYTRIGNEKKIIPSVLINSNTKNTLAELTSVGISEESILSILNNRDFLDVYKSLFDATSPMYTLFPDERQIRRAVSQNKVLFEDKFQKQDKNANYPEDEFFSEDHLYFKDEGFIGFGDYSIVGDEYTKSGFAPYAVAIHIVYFAADNTLRIRHFISDSNDDISDVAGKFHEAVSKLARWYEDGQHRQLTVGLETLLNHFKNGTYPGLPTLKKLSIMHHLELMAKYLDGGLPR